MKRIWMVYPYGPIYGEVGKECRYTQFGRELSSKGYDVVWWTTNFSHTSKEYRCNSWKCIEVCKNFRTILVPTTPYKKNISLARVKFEQVFSNNLKKAFYNMSKPDMLIVAGTGMFNAFEPCISFAKKNNIPLIYDIMDVSLIESYAEQHYKLVAPLIKIVMCLERYRERVFFRYISGISALGKNQLLYAKKRAFNRDIPTCLVYNSINITELRKQEQSNRWDNFVQGKKEGWISCIYAGSLAPSYDIDSIIKCASICQKNGDKIRFIIAGKGPQEEKVELAAKTYDNISYVGYVDLKSLFDLYRVCDIGLCPFMAYQTVDMPDKFYDYCAAGLATINSSCGEVQEIIDQFKVGKHYKAEDAEDMYQRIKEVSKEGTLDIYKKNAFNIGNRFDLGEQLAKLSELVELIFAESQV